MTVKYSGLTRWACPADVVSTVNTWEGTACKGKTAGFGVSTNIGTLIGDVNCDGVVDPVDAQILLQFIAGLIGALPCPQNADVNESGSTNASDAQLILQFNAGIIDSLPPGAAGAAARLNVARTNHWWAGW